MVVVLIEESFNHHHREAQFVFARVVRTLEEASGRRLGNPQRRRCFQAFRKHPQGVRKVARDALADTDGSNPLGLFIYRIANGWHELEPLAEASTSLNRHGECSHPECAYQDGCVRDAA